MRPLGPREYRRRRSNRSGEGRFQLNVQAVAVQTQTGSSLVSSAPVPPEQWSCPHLQGMEQHTHLARFVRCAAVPLALLTQGTRTAGANAGGIDHPQAAIMLSTVFMRNQHIACRTAQGPIRLEGKVGSWKAASFPGWRGGRWCIPRSGSGGSRGDWRHGLLGVLLREGRRKLGGAHRFRM
jgi:hypothetical protein